jgi:sporulation protein YlmC with PRC-barrel domain
MTMSETPQFEMKSEVVCDDGACGELSRVIIDPVARTLTHLVVEPPHSWSIGRMVPVALVASAGPQIRLRCSKAEFEALDQADVTQFVTGGDTEWNYEPDQVLTLPYYTLLLRPAGGVASIGAGGEEDTGAGAVAYDRVPVGEVEVRRGQHVHATDGDIGRVQGLVVDPNDHHVTHILLDEGHLWGHKQVAIPILAVTKLDDGVRLNLTKSDVRDLPPVDIHGAK